MRIALTFGGTDSTRVIEVARVCEELKFDAIYYGMDDFTARNLDCRVMQSLIAAATRRVRIGSMMGFVPHLMPTLLATSVAALDVISEGRYDIRLGPIYQKKAWEDHGYPLPDAATRIEILDEALSLLKLLFTTRSPVTFEGRHLHVSDARPVSTRVQEPHPPITLPAQGERMLNLVAKHADCWISGEYYLDPSDANERRAFLHRACQRLGRDVAEIEVRRELVVLLRDESGTARSLAIDAGVRRDALDRPDYAVGDINECVTKIDALRENGVQGFDVWLPLSQDQETLERLGSGVIPVFS